MNCQDQRVTENEAQMIAVPAAVNTNKTSNRIKDTISKRPKTSFDNLIIESIKTRNH